MRREEKHVQKFVRMVLGLFVGLGVVLSLVACQSGQTACNVSLAEILVVRAFSTFLAMTFQAMACLERRSPRQSWDPSSIPLTPLLAAAHLRRKAITHPSYPLEQNSTPSQAITPRSGWQSNKQQPARISPSTCSKRSRTRTPPTAAR